MNQKDYFDKAADTWDNKYITPRLISFLEKFVPRIAIDSGQAVLDVGTGTGVLIPYIVKAVGPSGSVTAIDLSEKMVQTSKAKYAKVKNVKIKVGNIEETTFPPETFDVVTCFGVFPHLENKVKALQNINSVLKRGGKLAIAHALSSKELKTHHKEVSKQVEHATLPENKDMILLLEQASFIDVQIKDEPGCYLCTARKPNKL